jgi:hypothetical protein
MDAAWFLYRGHYFDDNWGWDLCPYHLQKFRMAYLLEVLKHEAESV